MFFKITNFAQKSEYNAIQWRFLSTNVAWQWYDC